MVDIVDKSDDTFLPLFFNEIWLFLFVITWESTLYFRHITMRFRITVLLAVFLYLTSRF